MRANKGHVSGRYTIPPPGMEGEETEKKSPLKIFLFIIIAFFSVVVLLKLIGAFVILLSGNTPIGVGNVAVIKIHGMIMSEEGNMLMRQTLSSERVVKSIRQADKNPSIKAILLDINSPGGSAVASEEIVNALKESKKFKVALVRDAAVSGAYWVASATDRIVASRMSLVGSVGVIASYLEFSGLMSKYGVNYERLVAGKYKDMGSPYRKLTKTEEGILKNQLLSLQRIFLDDVKKNRNLKEWQVNNISTAAFFTGEQGKKLGLVDSFGGREEAVKIIKNKINESVTTVDINPKESFMEMLSRMMGRDIYSLGEGIGTGISSFFMGRTGIMAR